MGKGRSEGGKGEAYCQNVAFLSNLHDLERTEWKTCV